MNALLSGLCTVIACILVLGLGVVGLHLLFGQFEYVIYAVLGFFAFMAVMARINAR